MQLRSDQEPFVNDVIGLLSSYRKICAQCPTGAGKTVMFSFISKRYTDKNHFKSVLISVHRKELLQQTIATLYRAFGIIAQEIVAGMKSIPEARVYVGMIESTNKRIAQLPNIGLLIIDEAHIAVHNKLHEHFPDAYVIGFTATNIAASRKHPMKDFYEEIVVGPSIKELIKLNALAQNITYAPKDVVDREKLKVKNNEFDDRAMFDQFARPHYIQNTIDAYKKWSQNEKAIIFNVNVAHSILVTEAFKAQGYNCMHLDGTTPDFERRNILNWFKHTKDAILCNVGVATTGFDEPTIRCVIINKSTMSLPLWLQMCGRGSRFLHSKSMFTIIDMGANAIAHGDWCDDRDWKYLFHNPRKASEGGVAPVKLCPECDAINHASARVCTGVLDNGANCGYIFPVRQTAEEEKLDEYVILTKNVDISKIIAENKHRKENFTFFEIGKQCAANAKKNFDKLDNKIAMFVLQQYTELIKKWCSETKKTYSSWMQRTAPDHLYSELHKLYPKWSNPLTAQHSDAY